MAHRSPCNDRRRTFAQIRPRRKGPAFGRAAAPQRKKLARGGGSCYAAKIVELEANLLQTSCGYGAPLFDHQGERAILKEWAERKGEDGVRSCRREKNRISLDGRPTGLGAEA